MRGAGRHWFGLGLGLGLRLRLGLGLGLTPTVTLTLTLIRPSPRASRRCASGARRRSRRAATIAPSVTGA